MNALTTIPSNSEVYRASTDAAGLCREIVLKTAQNIQGRKYVKVEGWQAIAIAHGCAASADEVQRVNDEGMSGFRAVGIVRRMSDGAEIARAEGFLGDDEVVWSKRPVYARRAMVQTRAISRACRSAFAHVVVLIAANLSTTPAGLAIDRKRMGLWLGAGLILRPGYSLVMIVDSSTLAAARSANVGALFHVAEGG